jgi:hypothetical protein
MRRIASPKLEIVLADWTCVIAPVAGRAPIVHEAQFAHQILEAFDLAIAVPRIYRRSREDFEMIHAGGLGLIAPMAAGENTVRKAR